jgi:phosphatidylserine/phosphatidylglycerophosphate/cardiolipin synthase-like enzyme
VLRTLNEARLSVRLAAYSFTSPPVARALLAAHRRGVDVAVVVDEKSNRTGAGEAAVQLLVQAGVPVRLNGRYAIHHDKFIVVDGQIVQTGSFNYSRSAAERNSENVLVVRGNLVLARQYLQHWQSRWDGGVAPAARY